MSAKGLGCPRKNDSQRVHEQHLKRRQRRGQDTLKASANTSTKVPTNNTSSINEHVPQRRRQRTPKAPTNTSTEASTNDTQRVHKRVQEHTRLTTPQASTNDASRIHKHVHQSGQKSALLCIPLVVVCVECCLQVVFEDPYLTPLCPAVLVPPLLLFGCRVGRSGRFLTTC